MQCYGWKLTLPLFHTMVCIQKIEMYEGIPDVCMHRLITSTCIELLISEQLHSGKKLKTERHFLGMWMSLKMPKQHLKSKGFSVDIFSTWEPLGNSGFGSVEVGKVIYCDDPWLSLLKSISICRLLSLTYSCFGWIKEVSSYVQIQRRFQARVLSGFYL